MDLTKQLSNPGGWPVWKKLEFLGHWEVALGTTIATLLIVIVARYYYSSITGYILPDEAWYYNTFILDRDGKAFYRPAFRAIFLLFFSGVNDVWSFLFLGAVYSVIWTVACTVAFVMILRRLKVPENILSLLILSLPLFPVFTVLAGTILTETPGLVMALLGLYFCLRYVQQGGVFNSLLSSVFFFVAFMVRETYLIFALGHALLVLVLSLKRRSLGGILGYATPLLLASAVVYVTPRLSERALRIPTGVLSPDLLSAVAIGLGYGFNPLFAVFAVLSFLILSYDLFKSKSSTALFLALNTALSLGTIVLTSGSAIASLPSAVSFFTSNIIRNSHTSLTSVIGFPSLYRRLKAKRVAAVTIILLIFGSTMVSPFVNAYQRGLSLEPTNRLSLEYRAPYYRLYLMAQDSGKTLVFGGWHMRGIRMYMAMLPNVVLVPVGSRNNPLLNETQFRALLDQGWDTIFLYDDWFTIRVPSMIEGYPTFYSNILRSRDYPGYMIETLWVDGESYALTMIKTAYTNSGSATHPQPYFTWDLAGCVFPPRIQQIDGGQSHRRFGPADAKA